MTDPEQRRTLAEAEAISARKRVTRTLSELQARLNPRALIRDAADEASAVGTAAVDAGVETARRHPGAIVGIAAVGALFFARRQIAGLFGRDKRATGHARRS